MEVTENGKETYFSHKERMFPELEADGKIQTEQFLLACQGIADFVGNYFGLKINFDLIFKRVSWHRFCSCQK
jgi:hypothetical protein